MRTEKEVREQLANLIQVIDEELDAGTNDPIKQWAALKTTHAERRALEWVLEGQEVS